MERGARRIESARLAATRWVHAALVVLGAGGGGPGCDLVFDEDLRCGPGQQLQGRACVAAAEADAAGAAGQGAGDAGGSVNGGAGGAPAAGSGAGGEPGAPEGEFGATCVEDAECAEPAPFCAVQPGQPIGICTVTGCAADASLCPSGWYCLDLTSVGAEDICVEE